MDYQFFITLVDQCRRKCRAIHLHNFGEPLLDDTLIEKVIYVAKCGIKPRLFTNASLLNNEYAQALIEAGLEQITFSVDGSSIEEFERIRYPLEYGRVFDNIYNFIALNRKLGSPVNVRIRCCNTDDQRRTVKLFPGVKFAKFHNWADISIATRGELSTDVCSRLWTNMTILVNGDVALCHADIEGKEVVGNTHVTPIYDIWYNTRYNEIRQKHLQSQRCDIELCRDCMC